MCLHSRHYLTGDQHNLYGKNIIAFTFDIQCLSQRPPRAELHWVHQIKSRTSRDPACSPHLARAQPADDRKQEDNDSHR